MAQPSVRRVAHLPPGVVTATDPAGATVLKHDRLILLSDACGDVLPDHRGLGLYDGDTRLLSCLALRIDGAHPSVLRADPGGAGSGTIVMTDGATQTLALVRERVLGDGLIERLQVSNHAGSVRRLTVDVSVDADMADIFEVRGFGRARHGTFEPVEIRGDEIVFGYLGLDGRHRQTKVVAPGARIEGGAGLFEAAATITWEIELAPGATATLRWSILTSVAEERQPKGDASGPRRTGAERATPRATIHSDWPPLDRVVARGVADLDLLVTTGPDPGLRYLAAGIPWFAALFGRDAILAAFGAILVDPDIAPDTLRALAARQSMVDDPARDAEPGKIPHEIRNGEMASTGELPFGAYYGSADATPLWLVLLGETWDWTGDRSLLEELWPAARAAIEWMDRQASLDTNGFIAYERHAPDGLPQHGWKDAHDAIRDRTGALAEPPIALVEVQGYAFDARRRLARLARVMGDVELADHLGQTAARLRLRFERAFWVPDRAAYALALDGRGRPMDALGSNQAHALWSGIVGRRHVPTLAAHLTSPALDSGWGIRTLGANEAGYTPLGYHTGGVWPHDTAIAVAGLARAGFGAEAARLGRELIEAGDALPGSHLPELFCGFDRAGTGDPVQYPGACVPQAWAAAAPLLILRELLGLRPNASRGRLELHRPRLPTGVAELSIEGLRVGDARIDLHVVGGRGGVRLHVTPREGDLTVVRLG